MLGTAALLCLTQAIYFESRGEPVIGQFAVAEVVMNRVKNPRYPNTVCKVTHEDRGKGARDCQFSYTCDGKDEVMHETNARRQAERIAKIVAAGQSNLTQGAEYFHSSSVSPNWSRKFKLVLKVGRHSFYKK